jgi:hypothetical protein
VAVVFEDPLKATGEGFGAPSSVVDLGAELAEAVLEGQGGGGIRLAKVPEEMLAEQVVGSLPGGFGHDIATRCLEGCGFAQEVLDIGDELVGLLDG